MENGLNSDILKDTELFKIKQLLPEEYLSDEESDNPDYNIETDIEEDNETDNNYSSTNTKHNNNRETTIHIKDDFESVVTLSTSNDIVFNKKIQQIKQTIDTLLSSSFTLEECVKIHSIYNFNLSCLLNRNRFLQEFVLILVFMEHIGICFTKQILTMVFPKMLVTPKKKNYEKIKNRICQKFDFSQFIVDQQSENKNELSLKIEKYSSGILFYIKNRVLLKKENEFTKEDQLELAKMLLKNKNNSFISDPKLRLFNTWLSDLIKNVIIYNMYNIYSNNKNTMFFNKKKTIEYHINISLRIVLTLLTDVYLPSKDRKYISLFLFYRDDENGTIEKLVQNNLFQHIIKEILQFSKKEETLKNFKKQIVDHIKNVITNTLNENK